MSTFARIKKGIPEFFEQSRIVQEKWGGGEIRHLADMVWCLLRYGARPIDYVRFEFYKKNASARNRYLTIYRYFRVVKKLKRNLLVDISGDKINEYKFFKDYIKREWVIVDKDTSEDVVLDFIKRHSTVIAKPSNGEQGRGVLKIEVDDKNCISEFLELRRHTPYVLEEMLHNCKEFAEINNSSLNTIRVTTIVDKHKRVHIFSIILRAGKQGSYVDNWGAGGVGYNFDLTYGICNQYGLDKVNNKYSHHPGSDIQMIGFKLPYFNDLKDYVCKLASMVPEARYTGWDIAITPKGFDLVEMNCPAGHDMFQSFDNPVYGFMKNNW